MSEPLAVAFVEVRPEVDDFRSTAEEELRAGLDDDALSVRGAVSLDTTQAQESVSTLANETQRVIDELASQTSPEFARGFVSGAQEAVASAIELGTATEATNQVIIDGEAARQAFAAANAAAAASESLLTSATQTETQAVIEASAAETELARVRARRSQSVGPLRLAGIGLGAGVALFAATQGLRELGKALEVTGNDADTFEGKLRNAGSSILSGDFVGAIKALGDQARSYSLDAVVAADASEELAKNLKDAGLALNDIAGLAESRLAAAEQLTQVPQRTQTRIAQAGSQGDAKAQLNALRDAQNELREQEELLRGLNLSQTQLNVALERIFSERTSLNAQIERVAAEARPDILAPLVEAVTDARLTGDSSRILAALRTEATELRKVIDSAKTNADDRERFKNELTQVNREIETIQDEIIAEEERHRAAMLDKVLDVGVLEDLEAQVAGDAGGEGRARRAAAIERTLARGTIDGKRLTRDEKERLNAELISINEEIEGEQEAIAREAEEHARDIQDAQDRTDQAFIDAQDDRQRRANRNRIRIEASAQLSDDIRLSEDLQDIYREQIAAARKTINDQKRKQDVVAGLLDQLNAEEQNERGLRREQRRTALERREESLDLDISLAAAQDNERKEIKAHEAKIRYLTERIRHTREGTNQRKALRVQIAQERAEIKRLQEEMKEDAEEDEGGSFDQLAANFLTELENARSNFASNVGPTVSFPGMQAPTPPDVFQRPPVAPPISVFDVPSPFEMGRGSGTSQAEAAAQLREERGAPVSQGQGNELIDLQRTTNRLLRDIKSGLGHTEASTSRKLAQHPVETSVD